MKPIIGITCFYDYGNVRQHQNDTYINAVVKAGGIPVLLPCLKSISDILQHLDVVQGLIISGGPDADPVFFGEEPHPALGNVNPAMDSYELPVIQEALKRNMPLLGICRGEQMLSIATGGTLIQDIASVKSNCLKHRQDAPREYRTHSVTVAPGSKLAQILGAGEIKVNTFHHQAVKDVPKGFRVSAIAPDGIIEAIESEQHCFALGVQWHPECMWNVDNNYDPLFNALIGAAIRYAGRK